MGKEKLTAEGKRWKQKYMRLNATTQDSHARNLERKVSQLEAVIKEKDIIIGGLSDEIRKRL